MPETDQLNLWLKGFPKDEAEARIRDLERELASLRQALSLYQSLEETNGAPSADGKPENRPAAIRRILREQGAPMSPLAIKREMFRREWMTPEEEGRFYSAMSTMTKRGHLLRLGDGQYTLAPRFQSGSGDP